MTQEGYPIFYGPMPEGQEIPRSEDYSLGAEDELVKTVMLRLAKRMEKHGIPTLASDIARTLEAAEVIFKKELQEKKLPVTFYEVVMRAFPHTDKDGAFSEHDRLVSFVMSETLEVLNEVRIKGIDFLTQLPNRGRFDEEFSKRLEQLRKKEEPFSLCILDIDHFKKINDTYGHNFGDIVLKQVAEFLMTHIRSGDTAYRYGGEEFALVIEGNEEQVRMFLEKTVREIAQKNIHIPIEYQKLGGPSEYSLTVSIGAVASDRIAEKDWGLETFTTRADAALYTVKHSTRNGFAQDKTERIPKTVESAV